MSFALNGVFYSINRQNYKFNWKKTKRTAYEIQRHKETVFLAIHHFNSISQTCRNSSACYLFFLLTGIHHLPIRSRACQIREAFLDRHNILTWKWWTKLKIMKLFQGSVQLWRCQSARSLSRLLKDLISFTPKTFPQLENTLVTLNSLPTSSDAHDSRQNSIHLRKNALIHFTFIERCTMMQFEELQFRKLTAIIA